MSERDAPKTSVTVRIAGEEQTIRASAQPEYTRRCARFVDRRIAEIRSRSGLIEGYRAAILAALSITDELFQARDVLEESEESMARRADELVRRLEEAVEGGRGAGATAEGSESEGEAT